ncbi:hypothetical protein LTS08_001854 [Lithohypha guttulata]|nr:hypothetical protein LTS08_001854 [Lithohypha guttulata]
MSQSTKPCLVHYGDWDEVTDSHPAMKYMRTYTEMYDKRDLDNLYENYIASDFTYSKSTGQIFPSGKESWDAVTGDYRLFTVYRHEPYMLTCWETDDGSGWEMLGNAWLFANLPGDGSAAKVYKDLTGKEWEIRIPAGFFFKYRKEGGEIKVASIAITSDSGPVVVELLKRGVMKPSDLGL